MILFAGLVFVFYLFFRFFIQTTLQLQENSKIEIRKDDDNSMVAEIATAACPSQYQCSFEDSTLTVQMNNIELENGMDYYIYIENATVRQLDTMPSQTFTDRSWKFTYRIIPGTIIQSD